MPSQTKLCCGCAPHPVRPNPSFKRTGLRQAAQLKRSAPQVNILGVLASGPTAYRGEGVNHEKESFVGELKVQALEGGRAIMLSYSATLETGNVVHTESTLPGTGPDGKLCRWPVMSELPAVLPHPEVTSKTLSAYRSMAEDRRHTLCYHPEL